MAPSRGGATKTIPARALPRRSAAAWVTPTAAGLVPCAKHSSTPLAADRGRRPRHRCRRRIFFGHRIHSTWAAMSQIRGSRNDSLPISIQQPRRRQFTAKSDQSLLVNAFSRREILRGRQNGHRSGSFKAGWDVPWQANLHYSRNARAVRRGRSSVTRSKTIAHGTQKRDVAEAPKRAVCWDYRKRGRSVASISLSNGSKVDVRDLPRLRVIIPHGLCSKP